MGTTQLTLTVVADDGTKQCFGRLARVIKEIMRYEPLFAMEAKGELIIPFKDDKVDSKVEIQVT